MEENPCQLQVTWIHDVAVIHVLANAVDDSTADIYKPIDGID